jgi:hypothetical protein
MVCSRLSNNPPVLMVGSERRLENMAQRIRKPRKREINKKCSFFS